MILSSKPFTGPGRSCLCKNGCNAIGINKHAFAIDLHWIFGKAAVGWVDAFTGAAIEHPLMRPANHHLAVESAFHQRDILVRAYSLEGTYLTTLRTHQQDFMTIDLEGCHFAFPEIIQIASF